MSIYDSRILTTSPREALLASFRRKRAMEPNPRQLRLDEPFWLYLTDPQADTYLSLMGDDTYSSPFHAPARDLIENNTSDIVADLPPPILLLDLGPGYPDKSLPIISYLADSHISCRYCPVDISSRFLQVAVDAMKPFAVPVSSFHCLFEELPERLSTNPIVASEHTRLVLLGLTFMNFEPHSILGLIRRLLRPHDAFLVAASLRQGETDDLLSPYRTETARRFNFFPLSLVGLEPEHMDYFVRFSGGRIEMGFTIGQETRLEEMVLERDTEFLTAVSYRYTRDELLRVMQQYFSPVRMLVSSDDSVAVAVGQAPEEA